MRRSLGQPIIIENVSGADGSIASRVARARPDGYTIELGTISTHMLNGALYSLPYDVVNDFAPISALVKSSFILYARKTMAPKGLNELIAWLKTSPNKASAGIAATVLRPTNAFFQKQTGTRFALVPYRGNAPASQDLVAGQIDLLFGLADTLPLVRAGRIKAYAVTSDTRLERAPDLPIGEMGLPELSFSDWFSRQRARPRKSSTGSMRPPSRRWSTRRFELGLPILGSRFSHASSRPRRRSAHCKRPR
jgi:tripartite-type tricarboxylate transporter receptor subunit TctC